MDYFTDDKDVEKFLVEEYKYLPYLALTYASWNRKNVPISLAQYIIYFTIFGFMIFAFTYTAYLCLDDIAVWSQSIHFAIVGIICWTICLTGFFSRKEFIISHRNMMSSFCEYQSGDFLKGLIRRRQKEKKILLIFWPCYYAVCALIATIIAPMIDIYIGVNSDVTNKNGVFLKLPLALWLPFDVDNSMVLYLVGVFLIGAYCAISALSVSSGVLVATFIKQQLCLQLRLLNYSLKELENRSKDEYKRRSQNPDLYNDEERKYSSCYKECLKQNIKHHQNIISRFRQYERLASVAMSVPFIGGAVLLAMACIHIISDDLRIGPKITSTFLVLGEMTNMLMLCMYGEQMKQLGEEVRVSAYSIKWYDHDENVRRSVSIMHFGCLIPLEFKAAHILQLNMQTFATVMNSAYSYFNVMYAFKE
ncbi:odorant receptor 13a-like isoform X1 [Rhodnius prolixus]|uniref:odorant receptor 13a-like isoform X1 n=1 Tax=Rhodnius prolixus TaxID=13249 RepID=UPI003D18F674